MATNKTYAFIDAANLFYGGEKSLGWKIDYEKLIQYLQKKYKVKKVYYYAGIELHGYPYLVLDRKSLSPTKIIAYFLKKMKDESVEEADLILMTKHIKRVKFYKKLEQFGYLLKLKPTKVYWNNDLPVKKANCDVDMTLDLVRFKDEFNQAIILSGDGDFVSVLMYLQDNKKRIHILARSERSAKEIRQLAGSDFRDFHKLRSQIEFQ